MKVAISNNRAETGKIGQKDIDAWRVFNGSFHNVDVTAEKLMELIQNGYAYTAQHHRYRHSDNFIQGHHIALDMDTKDERSSIPHLCQNPFIASYATFIHTTPSHTEAEPKARVVFQLDRTIKDAGKYAELMTALVEHGFKQSDKACKDAARFFYGAKGCVVHWIGNILPLEDAARELVLPYRQEQEAKKQRIIEASKTRIIASINDVPESLLMAHSKSLLANVENAVDGQKYITLRNTAIVFGGYVAGGYYGRFEVERWLQASIRKNPNNVQDLDHADKTISESIAYGESRPLYFEVRNNEPQAEIKANELDKIHPPLTPQQKQQVQDIITNLETSKYWLGFHDGMTQIHRDLWNIRYGLKGNILDILKLGVSPKLIDTETGEIVKEQSLTVPYLTPDGHITNVEYRFEDGTIGYDNELSPSLYYVPLLFEQEQDKALVWDDSITAITTYLNYGNMENGRYQFVGLPHMPLNDDSIGNLPKDVTVILSPETVAKDYNLGTLKGRAKFLRLPLETSKMIQCGMTKEHLEMYLRQARKW